MRRSSRALATSAGPHLVGGEQADLLGRADFFQHGVERVLRQVGEVGVLPRLHHAGERELHAGDVRHDDEPVLAEPVAHVARQAVEHRVAVDQQHDALVAGLLERGDELVEVAADGVPLGLRLGHERERALGAEQHFGIGDDLAHVGRHGLEAVVADADDVDCCRARMRDAGCRGQGSANCDVI